MARIDHVVYGVQDLETAAERLCADFGFEAAEGDRFPWGGRNLIVPLGDQYLELLTIGDEAVARSDPTGMWFLEELADGDHLMAWALPTSDIEAEARRVGHPAERFEMESGGQRFTWRLVGSADAFLTPGVPFFIQWDDPEAFAAHYREQAASVSHRVVPLGIDWIEVSGDEAQIRERIGPGGAPVRIRPGDPAVHAISLHTREGQVTIRP